MQLKSIHLMPSQSVSKFDLWLTWISFLFIASTIIVIPFGKGAQIPCGLLAFCGLALMIRTRGNIFQDIRVRRYITLLLCYAVPVAISLIGSVSTQAPIRVLTMALLSFGGGIAVIYCCRVEKLRLYILAILAAVVAFWVFDALFQVIVGHDIFGFTPFRGVRYGGPFTKGFLLAAYLASFSPFLFFYGMRRKWRWYNLLVIYALMSAAELMSNTRTGWIMYAVVSVIFFYHAVFKTNKHRYVILLCCILFGTAVVGGLYKLSPSVAKRVDQTKQMFNGDLDSLENAMSGRLGIWHTSINVIKANPINGIGARNLREVYMDYRVEPGYGDFSGEGALDWVSDPHQLVLEVGVGTGLIGIVGLMLMYFLFWKTWHETNLSAKKYALPFAVMLFVAYFPFNTHAAHYGSLYALILWMMIALYVAFAGYEWADSESESAENEVLQLR